MMTKSIICLADSRKIAGRCIAGKTTDANIWIRPVSDRPTEEISEEERRYENGVMPLVLDIINVKFRYHQPNLFQTENWLIDDRFYWVKTGTYQESLSNICDRPLSLWSNHSSSYYGQNDRISTTNASILENSIFLIQVSNSKIIVRIEGAEFSNPRRKVRVKFHYGCLDYILPITDPKIEKEYLQKADSEYTINYPHYLCISLGLPHEDYCYILAATVFK